MYISSWRKNERGTSMEICNFVRGAATETILAFIVMTFYANTEECTRTLSSGTHA